MVMLVDLELIVVGIDLNDQQPRPGIQQTAEKVFIRQAVCLEDDHVRLVTLDRFYQTGPIFDWKADQIQITDGRK